MPVPDGRTAAAWRGAFAVLIALAGSELAAAERIVLDPFAAATQGMPACPAVAPPSYSLDESRLVAHQRIERGTSCALEGTCEPGGAYRHDPEINAAAIAALRAASELADTALWVSTSRKFVTVSGCVRRVAQQRLIEQRVKAVPGVEQVWVETTVGPPRRRP